MGGYEPWFSQGVTEVIMLVKRCCGGTSLPPCLRAFAPGFDHFFSHGAFLEESRCSLRHEFE